MASDGWQQDLARLLPAARLDEPLKNHTTFCIGGPADAYLEARSLDDLKKLYGFCVPRGVPVFLLGWGSNLLVLDGGIRGVVLALRGEFESLSFDGCRARAGAGVRLPALAVECGKRGLSGAEPLVGVPGTVGGSLVMNAGTRDGEIGALVREVEIFDPSALQTRVLARAELAFDYRKSNLGGRVVTGGLLELKAGDKVDILGRIKDFQSRRLKTQPIHTFNVGSIFKNPPGRFVAKLIEDAGLKGRSRGGARVSPLHANFIENERSATAADVLALIDEVREAVRARFGVDLELEVKVVGEAAPRPA
ncbi:MAG TPA: UDP-N-acetylmuramate dehydrogenase [Elusimicrobiota bacterium]|nr:UDP-N-acetylmuramate dehydrogenase [Elusimicrobiota bacterium]